MFIDLPNIGAGSVEQQLSEIRSYIYKNNEQLNGVLANLTIEKFWEQTGTALSVSGTAEEQEDALRTQYQKIRDLVIKTADEIYQTDKRMNAVLSGNYLAKGEFGEYLLNTEVEVNGASTGFEQLYTYSTELGSDYGNYKLYQQNFIKEGLLDDSGATPIYGVEVGLLTSEFSVDGEVVSVDSNKKIRITPDELSLWQDSYKVAYISSNKIYFPNAVIQGGSIKIGNNFAVDSDGEMTAKKGSFSGSLSSESVVTGINKYTPRIKIDTYGVSSLDSDGVPTVTLGDKGLVFNQRDTGSDTVFGLMTFTPSQLYSSLTGKTASGINMCLEDNYNASYLALTHMSNNNIYYDLVFNKFSSTNAHPTLYKQFGLHFGTPSYYYGQSINNANLVSCTTNGVSTKTGSTIIKCVDANGNEYTTNLYVQGGLITGFVSHEDLK